MTDTYIMTTEEVELLKSEDITVKEMKDLQNKVDNRFEYIVHKIAELSGHTVTWYDYDNAVEDTGRFDITFYYKSIGYTGEFSAHKDKFFDKYDETFPISWLCENFEKELEQEINEYKNSLVQSRQKKVTEQRANEKYLQDMYERICSKLTPEEASFVKMESITQAKQNLRANLMPKLKNRLLEDYKKNGPEDKSKITVWLTSTLKSYPEMTQDMLPSVKQITNEAMKEII